jgi:hypothetical protein
MLIKYINMQIILLTFNSMPEKEATTERYVVTGGSGCYQLDIIRQLDGLNIASMKPLNPNPQSVDVGMLYRWSDPSVTIDRTLAPRGLVNVLGLSVTLPKGGMFLDTTRTTVGLETVVNWADPDYLSAVHDIKGRDYSHLTMVLRDRYDTSHMRLAVTPKGIVSVEGDSDSHYRPFRLERGRAGRLMLGLGMMGHFVEQYKAKTERYRRTDLSQQRRDHQQKQQRQHRRGKRKPRKHE